MGSISMKPASSLNVMGDGGDTAQREGMYCGLVCGPRRVMLHEPWPHERTLKFAEVMQGLEIGQSGEFRRHPTTVERSKRSVPGPNGALVAAMGVHDDKERLERFLSRTQKTQLVRSERDLMGDPVHRNLVSRARDQEPNG
jgi:hypothetical protein